MVEALTRNGIAYCTDVTGLRSQLYLHTRRLTQRYSEVGIEQWALSTESVFAQCWLINFHLRKDSVAAWYEQRYDGPLTGGTMI